MALIPMEYGGGEIQVLTGTTPSTEGNELVLNFPTGFTYNNTNIIGLQFLDGTTWRGLGSISNTYPASVTASVQTGGIVVIPRIGGACSKSVKVTIYHD